jgi:hypothetical protein
MVTLGLAPVLVVAGITLFGAAAIAQAPPLAPGQRVSVNFAGGKEGTVVRIGTAADGSYAGCTRIHFDYEGDDPTTGQWFCAFNMGALKITPLGAPPGPAAFEPAPAPPALADDQGLPVGACVAIRGAAGRIIRLTPGGYVIQTQGQSASDAMNWSRDDVTPGPCPAGPAAAPPAAGPVSCPVADAGNLGATPQGQTFLAAIRSLIAHPAAPGMDGAVTVTFQSFQVGAGRRWTIVDSENFTANPNRPVYDARANFTTCTDFRDAIELRPQVSNFECFTAPAGETVCQMAATVNGEPGPTQRIEK